jgi:hypothetical protein
VTRKAGGEELLYLGNAHWAGQVEFGPGESLLRVIHYGTHQLPVRVDFHNRTFQLDAEGPAERFEALADRLHGRFPSPAAATGLQAPATARQLIVGFLELSGCLLFCVACAWVLLRGPAVAKDRWKGWLGLLLFGAGAAFSLGDVIRTVRARRR